jgi:N-acetylglucosaminyldiphosphoundecaprenol N-acetyl-beta-D-mannosaminyltransferase
VSKIQVNFFGTWVDQQSEFDQVGQINAFICSNRVHYVTYPNVHVVVTARNDDALRAAVNEADIASPDSKAMEFVARLKGLADFRRCAGPDMMLALLEEAEKKGYKNYFYGSTQQTLDLLSRELLTRFPALQIVKAYSPPFRPLTPEENAALLEEMNSLSPDLIWVGLGAPKQEKWIREQKAKLRRGVMLGVGAAFDFHAKRIKRAPKWMQRVGLEWLYRLMSEPRRLFMRYLTTNTLFLMYLVRYGVQIRKLES